MTANAKQFTSKDFILQDLNNDQRKVVSDYYGLRTVVAGPGSGKTRTCALMVTNMLDDGISPEKILLFSFTKKAANEIKERITLYAPEQAPFITMGTYHSFGAKLLRRYCTYLGWDNNFSIYDSEDKSKLLKKLVTDPDIEPKYLDKKISVYKENMVSPSAALQKAETEFEAKCAQFYALYQNQLKSANAFDFDDLIYQVIKLFELYPDILSEVNNQFHFVIADEAQDSSPRDILFLQYLSSKSNNLCLIMDDEQAIYAFRGANIKHVIKTVNALNFKKFTLECNYRSSKTIVNASRDLIVNNSGQVKKSVYTNNSIGEKIIFYSMPNSEEEALQIAKIILALVRNKQMGVKYEDIAILYRTSYLSRIIEETLIRNKIPYQVLSGSPFYARKEIKDILAYLNFIRNPKDIQSFERIVNTPSRKIGQKTLEKVYACESGNCCDKIKYQDILHFCKETARNVTKAASTNLNNFVEIIQELSAYIEKHTSLPDIIEELLKKTGYINYLREYDDSAEERIANVRELISIASTYNDIDEFIENLVISNPESDEDRIPGVNLLTMHASKGMEFPVVIIAGANEGTIPHFKSLNSSEAVAEERRLFYVAMTRAKRFLFITRPKKTYTGNSLVTPKCSRFVNEIRIEYISEQ